MCVGLALVVAVLGVLAGCDSEPVVATKKPIAFCEHQTATVRGTAPFVAVCGDGRKQECLLAVGLSGARAICPFPPHAFLVEANVFALAKLRADGRFLEVRELLPKEKVCVGAEAGNVRVTTLTTSDRQTIADFVKGRGGTMLDDESCGKCEFTVQVTKPIVDELSRRGEVRSIRPL